MRSSSWYVVVPLQDIILLYCITKLPMKIFKNQLQGRVAAPLVPPALQSVATSFARFVREVSLPRLVKRLKFCAPLLWIAGVAPCRAMPGRPSASQPLAIPKGQNPHVYAIDSPGLARGTYVFDFPVLTIFMRLRTQFHC